MMQFFIVWMIFVSLLVTLAPLVHPDAIKLAEEVKKTEVQAAPAAIEDSAPGGSMSLISQEVADAISQVSIENPITAVKKTAEEAARSIGRSLGQYIRGQYQQKKNEDLLKRFDEALFENLSGLQVNAEEKRTLMRKIEDDYIRDAESGSYNLDQQNFHDLEHVVKKEYSELELSRTRNGQVTTYDLKGFPKTQWSLQNGVLSGPAVTYYHSGEIKYIDVYEKGYKLSRKKYSKEGQLIFDQKYDYQKPAETAAPGSEPLPKPAAVTGESSRASSAGDAPQTAQSGPVTEKDLESVISIRT